jgi:tetratricopeptide (TPR) repeat protein
LGFISVFSDPVPYDCLNSNKKLNIGKLLALKNKSLVKMDSENSYFLHDIIRNLLLNNMNAQDMKKNHMFAAGWFTNQDDARSSLSAMFHFLEAGEYSEASKLAIDSSSILFESGIVTDYLSMLNRFDEKSLDVKNWAEILFLKGKANDMCGDWMYALLNINFCKDIASFIDEKELQIRALYEGGRILEEQNELEKAEEYYESCLEISKSMNYPQGIAFGYRGIGRIHWMREEYKEALKSFERCIEVSDDLAQQDFIASIYIDMGNVYDEMSETEKAIEAYNESIIILDNAGNTYELIRAYYNMAIAHRNSNNFEKAIEYYDKQMDLVDSYGDLKLKGYGYAGIGLCYANTDEMDIARECMAKAEEIARTTDNENILYIVNRTKGLIHSHDKEWNKAIEHYNLSLDYLRKNKISYQIPDVHQKLGLLYENAGRVEEADENFELARRHYKKLGISKGKNKK